MQNSKLKIKNLILTFCIFLFALYVAGCSVPNLEKPDCTTARQALKDFYSFHFGHEMQFTPENLRQRESFLSAQLINDLQNQPPGEQDPFTLTGDLPKAFRVGECEIVENGRKTTLQVLLFWVSEGRKEEREIYAEMVKENDKWLINKIFNK